MKIDARRRRADSQDAAVAQLAAAHGKYVGFGPDVVAEVQRRGFLGADAGETAIGAAIHKPTSIVPA